MRHDLALEREALVHAEGADMIADGLAQILAGIDHSQGSQRFDRLQELFDILLEHITESIPDEKARNIISAKVNLSARPGGYSFKDMGNMRWKAQRAMDDYCQVDGEIERSEHRLRLVKDEAGKP